MTDNAQTFDMESLFGEIFGTSSRTERGADLAMSIDVTRDEAYLGSEQRIEHRRGVECHTCEGHGGREEDRTPCRSCNATGTTTVQAGDFQTRSTCQACKGRKEQVHRDCATCQGRGHFNVAESLTVKIPAGIRDGMRLRLRGKGNESSGKVGDLYVTVGVPADTYTVREGADVFYVAQVSPDLAAGGGEVSIQVLGRQLNVRVPSKTLNGGEVRAPEFGRFASTQPTCDTPYRHPPSGALAGTLIVAFQILGQELPQLIQERLRQEPVSPSARSFLRRPASIGFFLLLALGAVVWLATSQT